MSSGILVFFIQYACGSSWSCTNSMPWSAGIESRNIRPRARSASSSAISTEKRLPLTSTHGVSLPVAQAGRQAARAVAAIREAANRVMHGLRGGAATFGDACGHCQARSGAFLSRVTSL
jgi:hypothetical protein